MIISTKRLYLRELTVDDAAHFFNINNDSDCIKYTGDIPFESIKHAGVFLKSYVKQYQDYKMGRWAVCLKETTQKTTW